MDNFMIVKNGAAIKCMKCGKVYNHPKDVEHKYCSNCNTFMDPESMSAHKPQVLFEGTVGPDGSSPRLEQFKADIKKHQEAYEKASAKIDRGHRYRMIGLVILILVIVLLTALEIMLRMGATG